MRKLNPGRPGASAAAIRQKSLGRQKASKRDVAKMIAIYDREVAIRRGTSSLWSRIGRWAVRFLRRQA